MNVQIKHQETWSDCGRQSSPQNNVLPDKGGCFIMVKGSIFQKNHSAIRETKSSNKQQRGWFSRLLHWARCTRHKEAYNVWVYLCEVLAGVNTIYCEWKQTLAAWVGARGYFLNDATDLYMDYSGRYMVYALVKAQTMLQMNAFYLCIFNIHKIVLRRIQI